jgi:tripartite ATP-independent transporter DctM subunit
MIPILLLSFFVLLLLRVPIAVALGISCALGLAYEPSSPPPVVAQRMFAAIDSFPLMAVPLYLLAGYLMSAGGIGRRIVDFSAAVVGRLPGGLAHVNIFSSMVFGGISGSAVADTAGIGAIMIPAMVERNFGRSYTAAVTAVSSTLGIIIPPSIPMVIIGAMLGVSVGRLFLGGVVPGILVGVGLMAVAWAKGAGRPGESGDSWSVTHDPSHASRATGHGRSRPLLHSLRQAFWALLMPVVILLGIVSGLFTPTEAGAVAVVYALVFACFVYRELKLGDIYTALVHTALSTAKVFFLIAAAGLYSWLLTANGFPRMVGAFLGSLTQSPTLTLALISLILLIVTTFMESIAAMMLLLPILYPVSQQVGIDPVHFGVVVVLSLGIGLVTPPVGLCLYVAADLAQARLGSVSWALAPFVGVMLALLVLCIVFPGLITALPNLVIH